MRRVAVIGATGQLGSDLVETFGAEAVAAFGHETLEITDDAAVRAALAPLEPAIVVNATAFHNVPRCETEEATAYAVNAIAPRRLARFCTEIGARFVQVSTDYVFDGTKHTPYDEWDAPNPQSVYGRSKLAGELELARDPAATIVRISWVFGEHGANMVKTVLRLAAEHETLRFVDDQRGRPTAAADAADLVARLAVERLGGVVHGTNQGEVSWFEFARAVLESAGLDPSRVEPIATADLNPPRPAPRPANSVLDDAVLRLAGLPRLPHYRESLDRVVAALQA